MFFQRQKYLQASASNNSNSDLSDTMIKTTCKETMARQPNSDWNEIGLPLPELHSVNGRGLGSVGKSRIQSMQHHSHVNSNVKSAKNAIETSLAKSSETKFALAIDKSSSCSSIQSAQLNNHEQEVRFKLGGKVRTYKKPRNGNEKDCASDTSSSNEIVLPQSAKSKHTNNRNIKGNQAILEREPRAPSNAKNNSISCHNLPQNERNVSEEAAKVLATTTSAPYYYSDLLTEEQKVALHKKLGNFASPPPLLSRCSAINNARYLGMTSLATLKAKIGSISDEKQLSISNNHDSIESTNTVPHDAHQDENERNEWRESCQNESHADEVGLSDGASQVQLKSIKLMNGQASTSICHDISAQSHIYQNYDSVPSAVSCVPNSSQVDPLPNDPSAFQCHRPGVTHSANVLHKSFDDYFCEVNSSDCPGKTRTG